MMSLITPRVRCCWCAIPMADRAPKMMSHMWPLEPGKILDRCGLSSWELVAPPVSWYWASRVPRTAEGYGPAVGNGQEAGGG
jgi:hypothetical protein